MYADRRTGSVNPAGGSDDGTGAADDTRGVFFDMHSYAQLVLWSWGDTAAPAPNQAGLRTLGRRMAWFNGYTPQQSDELYPTDGTTVEPSMGWSARRPTLSRPTTHSSSPAAALNRTPCRRTSMPALCGTRHARAVSVAVGPDTIARQREWRRSDRRWRYLTIDALLDSSRFNQSNGSETVRTIASVSAWLDQLPWDIGATAVAMSAADGAFNTSVETATQDFSTAGWSNGRHFVHVQGVSATTAQPGTPNATFVDVAPANQISTLQGQITERDSGLPLAATVSLTNSLTGEARSTSSAASNGVYLRTMREGEVSVRVSAPEYLVEEVPVLILLGGATTVRDFAMLRGARFRVRHEPAQRHGRAIALDPRDNVRATPRSLNPSTTAMGSTAN